MRDRAAWSWMILAAVVFSGPLGAAEAVDADEAYAEYNAYYGYLHAHSSISDDAQGYGSPGPREAYRYARDDGRLDWFGLSEHAEFMSRVPWNDEWRLLHDAADEANQDGVFAALGGFEYSNPIYGHVNVFNTDDFIGTLGAPHIALFYNWLARQEGSVATFNHPGGADQNGVEFLHLAYVADVDDRMVGMERIQAGEDFADRAIGYGGVVSYQEEAYEAGWHLGPVSAQDNHSGNWGTQDRNRTGVLALDLTRETIVDGLRRRRFFATTDSNLYLSFQAEGMEMGSRLPRGAASFRVRAADPDGEPFARVEVRRGLQTILDEVVSGSDVVVTLDVAEDAAAQYYYAFVTQGDGDQAMSSPIWIGNRLRTFFPFAPNAQ